MRFFLRAQNRLKHEKAISSLFSGGSTIFVYPIKLIYSLTDIKEDNSTFKVMVVASKRNFKRAVKRNSIKRKLREGFRLNVHGILEFIPEGKCLNVALVYISKEIIESNDLEKSFSELLKRLVLKLQQD